MRSIRCQLTTMTILSIMATVAIVGNATTAHASALDVSCTGTLSTTLSPGLLLVPQTITTDNTFLYSPCTSASDPTLTSGSNHSEITGTFSCLSQVGSATGTKTIAWNNGTHSTFTFNSTFTTVAGQFITIHSGFIAAGQFAGDTAVETVVGPAVNVADCLAPPGVTSRSSVTILEITGT